ncbi:MAG: GNAT family N-acetyltransferase, partial [Elusimicrobia bacterium]|nr:GNAT family N-acetyltransferase [Elusimicrobiota bacterium]
YRMGYDAWGEGHALDAYLASCRASPKYAAGTWWVLVGDEGVPLSSLHAHEIPLPSGPPAVGLGSIATPPELRGRGHASSLIAGFLRAREESHGTEVFFLFSDIAPAFYERFGFAALMPCPGKPGSILMARANRKRLEGLLCDPRFVAPGYF